MDNPTIPETIRPHHRWTVEEYHRMAELFP